MESKAPVTNKPVHIINIDIQDNHEEATMGAFLICDLVAMVCITYSSQTLHIVHKTSHIYNHMCFFSVQCL